MTSHFGGHTHKCLEINSVSLSLSSYADASKQAVAVASCCFRVMQARRRTITAWEAASAATTAQLVEKIQRACTNRLYSIAGPPLLYFVAASLTFKMKMISASIVHHSIYSRGQKRLEVNFGNFILGTFFGFSR